MDKNFGTDLGADFRAPITDAGSDGDTNVTPEASVDGTGTDGTTSAGAAGRGGNGGSGETTGAGGAAGNAGAAGAGS